MAEELEYSLEDLRPVTDSKMVKKIRRNPDFARTVLFICLNHRDGKHFKLKELANTLKVASGYAHQIADFFIMYDLLKKVNNPHGVVYIPLPTIRELEGEAYKKLKGVE